MVEIHGWITIRENYEPEAEDDIHRVEGEIIDAMKKLKYVECNTQWMNGECFLQISL